MTDNARNFATTLFPNFYANNAANLNAYGFGNKSRHNDSCASARIVRSIRLRAEIHAGLHG